MNEYAAIRVLREAEIVVRAELARVRLEEAKAEMKAFRDRIWLDTYGPRD